MGRAHVNQVGNAPTCPQQVERWAPWRPVISAWGQRNRRNRDWTILYRYHYYNLRNSPIPSRCHTAEYPTIPSLYQRNTHYTTPLNRDYTLPHATILYPTITEHHLTATQRHFA